MRNFMVNSQNYGCFLMKRQGGDEPPMAPLPEWPSLCPDYRQNLCFDHGMFGPGRLPDLTAFKGSGERTRVEKREKGAVQLEIAPTRVQLTHVCPRVPVRDVKLTAGSAAS